MTAVDINPYPLGKLSPTAGTPVSVLANFTDLAFQSAKVFTIYANPDNTGKLYVGRSNLNKSTLAGVLLILAPGETKSLPFNQEGGNQLALSKFYVDVDTTGDWGLADALFA